MFDLQTKLEPEKKKRDDIESMCMFYVFGIIINDIFLTAKVKKVSLDLDNARDKLKDVESKLIQNQLKLDFSSITTNRVSDAVRDIHDSTFASIIVLLFLLSDKLYILM